MKSLEPPGLNIMESTEQCILLNLYYTLGVNLVLGLTLVLLTFYMYVCVLFPLTLFVSSHPVLLCGASP